MKTTRRSFAKQAAVGAVGTIGGIAGANAGSRLVDDETKQRTLADMRSLLARIDSVIGREEDQLIVVSADGRSEVEVWTKSVKCLKNSKNDGLFLVFDVTGSPDEDVEFLKRDGNVVKYRKIYARGELGVTSKIEARFVCENKRGTEQPRDAALLPPDVAASLLENAELRTKKLLVGARVLEFKLVGDHPDAVRDANHWAT